MKLIKNIFLITLIFLFFFYQETGINIIKAESKLSQDLNNNIEFLHPDIAFVPKVKKINDKNLVVQWDIADGYYLYLGMFKFEINSEDTQIEKVVMPDGLKKTDEFFGDVDVYYNNVKANILLSDIPTKDFELTVHYQGCADAGLCYPPTKKLFAIDMFYHSMILKKILYIY